MPSLIHRIKDIFRRRPYTFEETLQALAEDEQYRKVVLFICKQNPFQRRSILRTQSDIMTLKRAPAELRALFMALEDDAIANKTRQFLEETHPS